jgi:hypothetical protein
MLGREPRLPHGHRRQGGGSWGGLDPLDLLTPTWGAAGCASRSVLVPALVLDGRFLIRLCDLVGAPRGRSGPFFCLPGRGGHLGVPATKWGGRGRPAGHAAVLPAVPR